MLVVPQSIHYVLSQGRSHFVTLVLPQGVFCCFCCVEDIIQLLKGFKLAPAVIQAAVNTLCLICSALTSKQDYQVKGLLRADVPLHVLCS